MADCRPHLRSHGVPMFVPPRAGRFDRISYWTPIPALAYTAVADTPEPVTPQAGVVGAEPDGPDRDTVPHV